MSLLLDALKRAEQEKLARQGGAGPASASARAQDPASLELQPLHAPEPAAPPPAPAGPRPEAGSHAVQNLFQAKAQAPTAEAVSRRTVLWVVLGIAGILALAGGGYVWYAINSLSPKAPSLARAPMAAPAPAVVAPPPSTAAAGSIVASGAPLPLSPGESVVAAPGPAASPAPAPGPSAAPSPAPSTAAAAEKPSAPHPPPETPAQRIAREAETLPPLEPPLRIDRAAPRRPSVPPGIAAGYSALTRGDAEAARQAYEAALKSDPTSVDAHLGLATLAARAADRPGATEHYRQALALDPRNATALAGLAALADFSRPEALETQLRADVARHPASAALHFTLGNVLASQGRWKEAQVEYFEAHRLDPGAPEIAHNLAVSLDHLGQKRLAADFYARALEGARGRRAAFDPQAVARRIAELR